LPIETSNIQLSNIQVDSNRLEWPRIGLL